MRFTALTIAMIGLTVSLPTGEARGQVLFDAPLAFDVGDAPYSVVIGDFDEDGHSDLAVANSADDDIWILIRDRNVTF